MSEDDSSAILGNQQTQIGKPDGSVEQFDPRSLVVSAALIGAGILVEPELLGGALLGAGVMYGLPLIGRFLEPVVRNAIGVGYSAADILSDVVSKAGREVQRMVVQARADYRRDGGGSSIIKSA